MLAGDTGTKANSEDPDEMTLLKVHEVNYIS